MDELDLILVRYKAILLEIFRSVLQGDYVDINLGNRNLKSDIKAYVEQKVQEAKAE